MEIIFLSTGVPYVSGMKTLIISFGMMCALAIAVRGQDVTKATCKLESKSGSQVAGTVTFTKVGDEVQVVADITGLKPGKHGVHLHEKGDCSAADAASAGAHWNPTSVPHGAPNNGHLGDLGNIEAGPDGSASLRFTTDAWMLAGGLSAPDNDVVGKAVVIHSNTDDLATQPSGNSGSRIGCGVVTLLSADAGQPVHDPHAVATLEPKGSSAVFGTALFSP